MKRFSLISLFLMLSLLGFAQRPYVCITPGAEMTLTQYDENGKENGTAVTKIISATGSNGNYDIVQDVTVPTLSTMTTKIKVTNGMVDMSVGGLGIEASGDIPFVPSRLAVGLELNCGTVNVSMGGVSMVTNTITSNKVIGREELKTPAGTFKCYIVEMVFEAKMIIKVKSTAKYWYARGLGVVKMENYDEKGKLISSQVLTEIKGI